MYLLLRLVALLPLPVLHAFGHFTGWLFWQLSHKRKRIALRNIARCLPELSPREQEALARHVLRQECMALWEMPYIWFGPTGRTRAKIRDTVGGELFEAAVAQGKGVILLAPHMGSWESVGLVQALHHPLAIPYKPQNSQFEELIHRGRSRYGIALIPAIGGGVRQQLTPLLAQNAAVAIMADQDPPPGRGVFAPFFGIPAHTPVLASRLLQATGARALYFYGERLPRGRGFRTHFHPVDNAVYATDSVVSAAAINAGFETLIRRAPAQYWWGYERFRRQPPGEPWFYQ